MITALSTKAQYIWFEINGAVNTYITCANDSGDFGGYYDDGGSGIHGFIYIPKSNDTLFIDYPGAAQTWVYGINNHKAVVGSYNTTGNNTDNEGFKYDKATDSYTDITSSWIPSLTITIARDINDAGCVVGDYKQSTTHVCFSMCAGNNGSFHYNYQPTYCNSLNNSGQRTGFWIETSGTPNHGLLWDNGIWNQIDYPGASRTRITGVNDSDVVVGVFGLTSTPNRSFFYRNGVFKEIKYWKATDLLVNDINNKGMIVGCFKDATGKSRGFYRYIWDSGLRPNPNGWSFGNYDNPVWPTAWYSKFDYHFDPYLGGNAWFPEFTYNGVKTVMPDWVFPDWPLFVETFGDDSCYIRKPGHAPVLKQKALNKWKVIARQWFGSCYGFAHSSFMAWDDLTKFMTKFPKVGKWTPAYTIYPLGISEENRLCVNHLQICQYQKKVYRNFHYWYNKPPTDILAEFKKILSQKKMKSHTLRIYNQNGGGGHELTPYKIMIDTLNPDKEWIYVYENLAPDDESKKIVITKSTNSWSYVVPTSTQWGGPNAHRGLVVNIPADSIYNGPVTDSVKYEPDGSKGNYIELFSSSEGNIFITNNNGDSIGCKNNMVINNFAAATPIIPISGRPQNPIGYYLPDDNYNIKMQNYTDSLINFSVFTDNDQYLYSRGNVSIAEKDIFTYNNSSGLNVFNTDNTTRSAELLCLKENGGNEMTYTIGNLSLANNANVSVKISDTDLSLVNKGGATTYDLNIRLASGNGEEKFMHDTISIDANTTHKITPKWTNLQTNDVTVFVDNSNNSTVDDTLYFGNEEPSQIISSVFRVDTTAASVVDTIYIDNNGGGTLNWTAASNSTSWLTVLSGSSGTNYGMMRIKLTANTGAARTGKITVSSATASNSPYTIIVNQAGVMTAPTDAAASDGTLTGGIDVTWTATGGATHYMVFRSDTASKNGTAISGWIAGTDYTDNTPVKGKYYYYCVKAAQNASGLNSTGYSNVDCGWTSCFVADYNYSNACTGQPVSFTENSTSHSGAFYLWDINNDGSIDYTGNPVSHTFTSAGNYPVKLTVTDSSACSDVKTKTIQVLAFPAVNLPQPDSVCANQNLTLNAGSGFNSYLWSTGATTSSVTVDSAGFGPGVHSIYVQVTNSNGCSAIDTTSVTFYSCVNIIEPASTEIEMNIYPNPANATVNISVKGAGDYADMKIFNVNGQVMFAENIEDNSQTEWNKTFSFERMAKGIYFVKLVGKDSVKFGKIVIY